MLKTFAVLLLVLCSLLVFPPRGNYFPPPPPDQPRETTLFLVGDIMLDRGVEHYIREKGDWRWPFLEIADFLQEADLLFGNLESMISDQGSDLGSVYSFRADPRTMAGLELAGFDVLSVANNHSFDYGRPAFEDTLRRLREANIEYVGGGFNQKEAHAPVVKTVNQTKIGFLGYSGVGSPLWQAGQESGIAWMDSQRLEILARDIQSAQKETDILIVSFHFGEEYQKQPNEEQRTLAEAAIDYGADLVAGHHPHVIQPLEKYQDGWIAYSLGNFVFDQYFSEETMRAAILKATIKNKTIDQAVLIPTRLTDSYQVRLAD